MDSTEKQNIVHQGPEEFLFSKYYRNQHKEILDRAHKLYGESHQKNYLKREFLVLKKGLYILKERVRLLIEHYYNLF